MKTISSNLRDEFNVHFINYLNYILIFFFDFGQYLEIILFLKEDKSQKSLFILYFMKEEVYDFFCNT